LLPKRLLSLTLFRSCIYFTVKKSHADKIAEARPELSGCWKNPPSK
jgi:hypothetical protein